MLSKLIPFGHICYYYFNAIIKCDLFEDKYGRKGPPDHFGCTEFVEEKILKLHVVPK